VTIKRFLALKYDFKFNFLYFAKILTKNDTNIP
jgi:hypothetical protein